jgi:hypothetical protein
MYLFYEHVSEKLTKYKFRHAVYLASLEKSNQGG